MQRVDLTSIPHWNDTSGVLLPASIDSVCPGCHRFVNLSMLFYDRVQRTNTYLSKARCPACAFEATVVTLNPQESAAERDAHTVVAIHPPIEGRVPMRGAENLPERVSRAYEALLNVHKAGEWTAVASLAGRVLEAIAREAVPDAESGAAVHELVERIPEHTLLAKPLHDLAAALHPGEALGRLVSMETPADEGSAATMIEAVEMLAQYLLLLPERFEALSNRPLNEKTRPEPKVRGPRKRGDRAA